MKKLTWLLSIVSLVLIVSFFVTQNFMVANNAIMSRPLQWLFGIGFLMISLCLFSYLVVALMKKRKLPLHIELNWFEMFVAAVAIGVVALFLIHEK